MNAHEDDDSTLWTFMGRGQHTRNENCRVFGVLWLSRSWGIAVHDYNTRQRPPNKGPSRYRYGMCAEEQVMTRVVRLSELLRVRAKY